MCVSLRSLLELGNTGTAEICYITTQEIPTRSGVHDIHSTSMLVPRPDANTHEFERRAASVAAQVEKEQHKQAVVGHVYVATPVAKLGNSSRSSKKRRLQQSHKRPMPRCMCGHECSCGQDRRRRWRRQEVLKQRSNRDWRETMRHSMSIMDLALK